MLPVDSTRIKDFVFCTYFNSEFLDRGIALIESGRKWHPQVPWAILCMDTKVEQILQEQFGTAVHLTAIRELEDVYPDLPRIKKHRSIWEYILTCRCHYIEYLVMSDVRVLVCLDGDFYFFGELRVPFSSEYEVMITPHHFSERLASFLQYGKFNAGFTVFKKGDRSHKILRKWCQDCLDSCSSVAKGIHYTDQKYLDQWEGKEGVYILEDTTIHAAPWNQQSYPVTMQNHRPYVEDKPLCLFHFHGLREFYACCWISGLAKYDLSISAALRDLVYMPYLQHLVAIRGRLGFESLSEPILLPALLPENMPYSQKVAISLADAYTKSQELLFEKEEVIRELRLACEERLTKVVKSRARLSRTEMTSLEYWFRRLFRRPLALD